MSKTRLSIVVAATVLGTAAFFVSRRVAEQRQPAAEQYSSSDASARKALDLFEQRIRRNPRDAVSYTLLAEVHERAARWSGDAAGYGRAEEALRRALGILPDYPLANARLASVLYEQHRFKEALELARRTWERDPRSTQALATLADARAALGDYQEAEAAYRELGRRGSSPPVLARLAHWAYLQGDTERAVRLMRRALDDEVAAGARGPNTAWYQARLGELHFGAGRVADAARHYESAIEEFSGSEVALAGLGRVRAAQGRYGEAIELYERSLTTRPRLAALAELGDLYSKTGDEARARLQYEAIEVIARAQKANGALHDRELSYFYADHDLKIGEALRLAQSDWKTRKDVHGADALAWALYKSGRHEEAAHFINEALKLGTQEARFYYHAGMIHRSLREDEKALRFFERAVAINPYFSLLQAEDAFKRLAELGG